VLEDVTAKGVESLFDKGLLGVLLVLSWVLFAFMARYLVNQIKEAKEEVRAERADHRATIVKQMEDIRNLTRVPSSVDNIMPIIEMIMRTQKGV
jgi:hypothetical protein